MNKQDQKSSPEGTVVSQPFNGRPRLHTLIRLSRRSKLVVLVVGLILIGVFVMFVIVQRQPSLPDEEKSFGAPLLTEQQAIVQFKVTKSAELEELKKKSPAENASIQDKINYYTQLEIIASGAQDYQTAINAFETRDKFAAGKLEYTEYYTAASYYRATGDKQKAVALIDTAIAHLPAKDDLSTGYIKDRALATLQQARTEYAK